MSDFFWFSDAQWARIAPLLPQDTRGKERVDDRRVLSGIVHALKCGGRSAACGRGFSARWRARRKPRTGCTSTVPASRFTAAPAAEKGGLGPWYRPHEGRAQHQAPRHLRLKGRPLVILLTPGNVHDCKVAKACIEAVPPSAELVADKGYDSKALREWLEERGTTAVIPPRKNRKVQYDYDKAIYKQRNVIERLFCRQGLAEHRNPLRPQHQKLHGRCRPCRHRHLVALMSLDLRMSLDPRLDPSRVALFLFVVRER